MNKIAGECNMNDQKFIKKWEKNRRKGKRRFYAEMGLAGFIGGIPMRKDTKS